MEYILGTRGSALALAQTQWVQKRLQNHFPNHIFSIQTIVTKGDLILDRPLDQVGGKGIFVKEIEQQLLEGKIHIGVHSLKDMPTISPEGLYYTKFWKRENPFDVLILPEKFDCKPQKEQDILSFIPYGGKVGTGSKRRIAQLKYHRPDLEVVPIRGNINTRLEKIESMQLDGIILAAAGLHRLQLQNRIAGYFSPDILTPAPGQGTLALEISENQPELLQMLDSLADPQADFCATVERCFLRQVDGGCHTPVGAYCHQKENMMKLIVFLGSQTTTFAEWKKEVFPASQAEEKAKQFAKELLQKREDFI